MQLETIQFYGSTLYIARDQNGDGWVAVRPICDAIGVHYQKQYEKLSRDPRFSWNPMVATGSDGKRYEMTCIPISQVNAWLFTINPNKVQDPVVRERLIVYQEECAQVLFRHFMPQGGTNEELARSVGVITQGMEAMRQEFGARFDEMGQVVRGVRTDLDELRELVETWTPDNKLKEAQSLLKEAKEVLGQDGRTIIGRVRATLGISRPYDYANIDKVINVLKNLLGRGLQVLP